MKPKSDKLDLFDDPAAIDETCQTQTYSINCSPANADAEGELLFSIDVVIPINPENLELEQEEESTCSLLQFKNICEDKENRNKDLNLGLAIDLDTSPTITVDSPTYTNGSNLKRRGGDTRTQNEKKTKKSISFVGVTVYHFPRIQGFGCVPSNGGCTLGMDAHHISCKSYTMAEHLAEQRLAHGQQINNEDSNCDTDTEKNSSLKPLIARQRREILTTAGIKIKQYEAISCGSIRKSRRSCGCNCQGVCDPDKCTCSQQGIKCQKDRFNFPCGCTSENCGNAVGRIESDPVKVRQHYLNTMKRLDLQQRLLNEFSNFTLMEPEMLSAYASLLISNGINI